MQTNQNQISGYIKGNQKLVIQEVPRAKYPIEWNAMAHAVFNELKQIKVVKILTISKDNSSWNQASWKKPKRNEQSLMITIQLQEYIPSAHLRELLLKTNRLFKSHPDSKVYYTVIFEKTGSRSMQRLYPSSQNIQNAFQTASILYCQKTKQLLTA